MIYMHVRQTDTDVCTYNHARHVMLVGPASEDRQERHLWVDKVTSAGGVVKSHL